MRITFVFSLTDTEKQETPPIRKRKSNDERSSIEENKRPKSSVTYPSLKEPYQIGTSSWIRKKISTYALESHLVSSAFSLFECLLSFCYFIILMLYYIASLLTQFIYQMPQYSIYFTTYSHAKMGFGVFIFFVNRPHQPVFH
jgi:hypothetical protein